MDYFRIRHVASFAELVETPFADGVNALCWRRQLEGDFAGVAGLLSSESDIVTLDEDDLARFRRGAHPDMQAAIDVLRADQRLLADRGLDPILDYIPAYPHDAAQGAIATDVYSFHADRAPVMADTYLCTYTGAASEGLRNEDAVRRMDMPDVMTRVRAEFVASGAGGDFAAWLSEKSYDLHYAARPGAEPYAFGTHNLWRIAISWPGCPVPPCIHRAPQTKPGDLPRLLLIS